MKNKTENFNLISLIISFLSLIISFRVLYINETILNMEKKEDLLITVGANNFSNKFGTLNYICDDGENILEYTMEVSIHFYNNSKLPIYIERGEVSKSFIYDDEDDDDVVILPYYHLDKEDEDNFYGVDYAYSDIEEMRFPICIDSQDVKKVDCKIRIQIPETITKYILKEFADIEELDIYEIDDFLFSNKHIDIQGNHIDTYRSRGEVKYKYMYDPFCISFYSSRGNCFSTNYFAESYISSKVDKIEY